MKAKNGVVDKYHRLDGNAMRIPCETGSRSGAMEDHNSQPSQRRRHLVMMMIQSVGPLKALHAFCLHWQTCSIRHQLSFSGKHSSQVYECRQAKKKQLIADYCYYDGSIIVKSLTNKIYVTLCKMLTLSTTIIITYFLTANTILVKISLHHLEIS